MKARASNRSLLSLFTGWLLLLGTACVPAHAAATVETYGGRDLIVYVPSSLPPPGARALVVVLHGGLGNAQRIESQQSENGLNMDSVAEKNGFIVAYLNGTPVTRFLGSSMLGWNAGGCCGQSAKNNVDDVGYIKGAVDYLAGKYGIDRSRVYGMGHSNGALMTQRLICQTNLFAAGVAISGPLDPQFTNCPDARGKRILAIHGADDENVPVAGGKGTKGLSGAVFNSEDAAQQTFRKSGASYDLQVVTGADHKFEHIDAVIQKTEGMPIAQKAARFFGLLNQTR
jgi:poly(3-hydroxybutyrate) depolymerase